MQLTRTGWITEWVDCVLGTSTSTNLSLPRACVLGQGGGAGGVGGWRGCGGGRLRNPSSSPLPPSLQHGKEGRFCYSHFNRRAV